MTQHTITVQELQQRLNDKDDIVLLDVRMPEEHKQYNIGGVLIPLPELPQRLTELNADKTIVVYCRSGGRSMQAVHLLLNAQFKSVLNLQGGMMAWQKL